MTRRRILAALALLVVLSWSTLGIARAADAPGTDPLAKYIVLIDHVRTDLTSSLDEYRAGNAAKSLQLARSAYLDSFELVEFPLRDRDPDLTLEMEDAFAVLRGNIRAGVPVDVITDNIARLQTGMDDVEKTLSLEGYALLVVVGVIGFATFRLGRRLPLTAFFGISVVIVMAISVAFLGNAVRSLQEGYVVGITNLTSSMPRLPISLAQATGYHPTFETIAAQVVLILAYGIGAIWVLVLARRRSRHVATVLEARPEP